MRLLFAGPSISKQASDVARKLERLEMAGPLKRQSPASAAADRGWSIRVPAWPAPTAAAPAVDASEVVLPSSISITLDMELTAEEAQCIAQPPADTTTWEPSATSAAEQSSKPSSPRALLHRAAASLHRLRSRLALATCMARPAATAE
ncbi:hypothetical protein ABPG75_004623 [Micractinium tetrahymenae]